MGISGLKRIERMNYVLGGILIAAAAILAETQQQALGVLVGVVLSAINFSVMRRMVEKWVAAAAAERAPATFFMVPKMALLMVAIFLALWFLPISAGGLAVGFSVFLVSITIETVRHLTNPPAPAPDADDSTSPGAEDES